MLLYALCILITSQSYLILIKGFFLVCGTLLVSTLLNQAFIILKSNHILRVSIRSFSFAIHTRKCSQRKLIPTENPVYSISLRYRYIENPNTKEKRRLNWKIKCNSFKTYILSPIKNVQNASELLKAALNAFNRNQLKI